MADQDQSIHMPYVAGYAKGLEKQAKAQEERIKDLGEGIRLAMEVIKNPDPIKRLRAVEKLESLLSKEQE